MPSNFFGEFFRITTWGESHGKALGLTIDGVPAGINITPELLIAELKWRKPGSNLTSPRQEQDYPEILSGVFENKSTGAPISILFYNNNADKSQYSTIKDKFRPGHANYTYLEKYGIYDHNGGGRASARETVCRVAASAIAKALLPQNIKIYTYLSNIGDISLPKDYTPAAEDLAQILNNPVFCPHKETADKMIRAIEEVKAEGDSLGGTVSFLMQGVPSGLGDPIYQKLEAKLAAAMLSIPASKGFEIGMGFQATTLKGSEHNDSWYNDNNSIAQTSNNCGGILGGISTGTPIYGKVAFKPTSSIKITQQTVTTSGKNTSFSIPKSGRHDPCVAIRATAVVKAMCYLTLADSYLANKLAKV